MSANGSLRMLYLSASNAATNDNTNWKIAALSGCLLLVASKTILKVYLEQEFLILTQCIDASDLMLV